MCVYMCVYVYVRDFIFFSDNCFSSSTVPVMKLSFVDHLYQQKPGYPKEKSKWLYWKFLEKKKYKSFQMLVDIK